MTKVEMWGHPMDTFLVKCINDTSGSLENCKIMNGFVLSIIINYYLHLIYELYVHENINKICEICTENFVVQHFILIVWNNHVQ